VYNVCLPLLRDLHPDRPPIRIVEVPVDAVRTVAEEAASPR
jgi:hypothetical protein